MSAAGLRDALALQERGLATLPIRAGSKQPDHRVIRSVYGNEATWAVLRDRPASAPEVRAWFDADPTIGVGVITGDASRGLVVLDLDQPWPGLRHPPTPTVATRRGQHLYLRADGSVDARAVPGLDLLAGARYALAPPSIHPTGSRYRWSVHLGESELANLAEVEGLDDVLAGPTTAPRAPEHPLPHFLWPSVAGRGEDEEAATWPASDVDAVRRAAFVLGIRPEFKDGKSAPFGCVLPGHGPDRRPSASLIQTGSGVWAYHCFHDGLTLPLADVFAAQHRRQVGRPEMRGPERWRWWLRLWAEAGVAPVSVHEPALPSDAIASDRRVAAGFALLQALRDVHHPDEGAPFTRAFAAPWCGVTTKQARLATERLVASGVLTIVGETAGSSARPALLYRLGAGS